MFDDPRPVSTHQRRALGDRHPQPGAEKGDDEDDDGKAEAFHDVAKGRKDQHDHNAKHSAFGHGDTNDHSRMAET